MEEDTQQTNINTIDLSDLDFLDALDDGVLGSPTTVIKTENNNNNNIPSNMEYDNNGTILINDYDDSNNIIGGQDPDPYGNNNINNNINNSNYDFLGSTGNFSTGTQKKKAFAKQIPIIKKTEEEGSVIKENDGNQKLYKEEFKMDLPKNNAVIVVVDDDDSTLKQQQQSSSSDITDLANSLNSLYKSRLTKSTPALTTPFSTAVVATNNKNLIYRPLPYIPLQNNNIKNLLSSGNHHHSHSHPHPHGHTHQQSSNYYSAAGQMSDNSYAIQEKFIASITTEIIPAHNSNPDLQLIPASDVVLNHVSFDLIQVYVPQEGSYTFDKNALIGSIPKNVSIWIAPLMESKKVKMLAHLPNDLDNEMSVTIKFYLLIPVGATEITLERSEQGSLQKLAMFLGKHFTDIIPVLVKISVPLNERMNSTPASLRQVQGGSGNYPLSGLSPNHPSNNNANFLDSSQSLVGPGSKKRGLTASCPGGGLNPLMPIGAGGGGAAAPGAKRLKTGPTGLFHSPSLGGMSLPLSNQMVNPFGPSSVDFPYSFGQKPSSSFLLGGNPNNLPYGGSLSFNQIPEPTRNEDDEINQLLGTLKNSSVEIKEMEPSPLLKLTLRPYQKQALGWMVTRERSPDEILELREREMKQLPKGWKEFTTNAGKKYYHNEITEKTTWEFPVERAAAPADGDNMGNGMGLNGMMGSDDSNDPIKVFNPANVTVRGGILADQMGMGKTIEVLSLILTNRHESQKHSSHHHNNNNNNDDSESDDDDDESESESDADDSFRATNKSRLRKNNSRGRKELNNNNNNNNNNNKKISKTNLVVCPLSVLAQWTDEIRTHSEKNQISVYVYHGPSRVRDIKYLAQQDVVITTYATLAAELPNDKRTNPDGTLKKKKKKRTKCPDIITNELV